MRKARHNKLHILGIVGACLFVLLITLLLPGTATAAKNVENTYAVVVTTGNDSGDGVTYFGLKYVDTDGYTHLEYVFPHKGGLQESLKMASNKSTFANEKALQRGKTDTYFFEPAYEVAQITGLEIYCQGEQGNLYAWEVAGLRIYRVDQIIDVVSNGENCVTRFSGSQLAYMEERNGNGGTVFSWTGNSVFQLAEAESNSYRLVFETVPYSMEGNFEYVIRMDFADMSGAGFEKMSQAYNQSEILSNANFGEYMAIQIEYMDTFGDSRCVTQSVMTSTVSWLMENGVSGDTRIAALAQQGETIAFGCTLQDMQSIKAITLHTGTEAAALLSQTISGTESASITGISVYPASAVSASPYPIENAACGPEYYFASDPLFYHAATTAAGELIAENGNLYISMRPYEPGAILKPTATTERYLVELISDSTQILHAPTDLLVELSYVDMTGAAHKSGTYSVRNAAEEFYGYWPASTEEFAYLGQVTSDKGICFVMELGQVEHFTGLNISVPTGSGDWQMAGFRVIRLDSLSQRICVWENVIGDGAMSNRRYYREAEGYTVFSMEEKALIQPDSSCEIDFVSQSVQNAADFDWSEYRYAMSYDQCMSNLGLAKVRENYTVEVQVQSGTTSLLDGYGDNGSKNRFYFLLQFENGASGYVLANQQLSADGFRSGSTETFTVSTNYDYGELVAVHIIPDDISEDSDPYDKLNIAQIRVRQNSSGSISKEWVIQNVGWIGIDYQDEGASSSISGQRGRTESDLARIYPISYSYYALNMEFRLGTGTYTDSGSGGAFYGTIEGTLEYYNKDGKRKQMTFDLVRAMYDYANKTPIYVDGGATGTSGAPLAVTDNSFMFRENHTDRFVISVSDVAKLGKLTLNMKSLNGGNLEITNVTAAVVTDSGPLQINDQDEYVRMGTTEYLCEDTVDKIPAFDLFLPTDRNIYQDVYFTEHEAIKLDTKTNTWISTVSRVPSSQNDVMNVFVYLADDASGAFDIDVRAQYTNNNGIVVESGAKSLNKITDADGKKVYAISGLTANGMSSFNRIFVKAQSANVVEAYIDHAIVQQVRAGVVINTFYLNCEHMNAETEFYVLPTNSLAADNSEQTVSLILGHETEDANLVSENRDIAVALQYTTISGGDQVFTSPYVYATDQQYQSIKSGDILQLNFKESYVKDITGILIASTGNIKAHVDMACVDNYGVDSVNGTKQLRGHYALPTGATVRNDTAAMTVNADSSVEILDIRFVTAQSDDMLESGTTDPILMVLTYTDQQGVQRELVIENLRDNVVSEGPAFATGSTTDVRLLLRNIAYLQTIQLMPYNVDPLIAAGWKPSQLVVSLGANGSLQKVSRSLDTYIYEDAAINWEDEIVGEMVRGLKVSLSNIILTADVAATNDSGIFGNSYRVNSASNKNLSMIVTSGATMKFDVEVANTKQGFAVKAEQVGDVKDISGLITDTEDGFVLTLPRNKTDADQTYEITINSKENENVSVVITVTVKSEVVPTEPTEPVTQPTEPETEPTEVTTEPTEATTEPTEPTETTEPTDPTDPTETTTEPTDPTEATTEPTEPTESTEATE